MRDTLRRVSELLIGYALVSTDAQDLSVQCDGLQVLGVAPERVYVDHGLTSTHRDRPGCAKRSPPAAPSAAPAAVLPRRHWTPPRSGRARPACGRKRFALYRGPRVPGSGGSAREA
jgi:hypothetical protein